MALRMFPLLPWLQLEDAPLDSLPPVLLGPRLCLVVVSFVKRWTWQKLHLDSLDLVGLSIGFS